MASGTVVRDKGKELIWRRHLAAQAAEGVSIRAFCKAHGISEQSFHWWRRELRRRDAVKATPAFVPVTVKAAPTAASAPVSAGVVEILLSGDPRVRLTGKVDRQQLVEVLSAMEAVFRPAEE
jgi:transposase